MADGIRVALLARPGTACEKLQAALLQAGADVVHVGDPTAGDAAALSAADPRAILVALEPEVEPSLDAFQAILDAPGRIVIYDEADLAARREGWDAARWSRHLSAKLAGHGDVLPPGAEPIADAKPASAPQPTPGPEAEPVPELDAEPESLSEPEPQSEPENLSTREGGGTRAVTIEYSGSGLLDDIALAPMETGPVNAAPGPFAAPHADQEAGLPGSPVEAEPPTGGAVVLAGVGGPDAVRQFLAALPDHFPRPVLIRQRLDGGRHDRLVRQLQRATPLPVELAVAGSPVAPGHVYILPDAMATEPAGTGLRFIGTAGEVDALAGLAAADSAVLLLSGADPAQVDAVMALAGAGTLVAGQSPEECFDNAAPGAAIALGADSGSPTELAARLASRWNS
jgi:chemosensory pili system protein ChpB (putative protein-glutamate methylesterase)